LLAYGTILQNRYRIVRQIGAGGSGWVYLAVDLSIGKKWAVKQILYQKGTDAQSACHEISMMGQLDYRVFPRIVDAWQEEACCYIVSDYVEGMSLDGLLKQGKIPEKAAIGWAEEIAKALRYLHEREPQILYLDLKPENIMVKADGTLRLVDFGIAQRTAEAERHFGTPGYAAPEQYRTGGDRNGCGPPADIFALGMTVYAMLCACTPTPDLKEQRRKITESAEYSHKIKQFMLRCIRSDQKERFQNMDELLLFLHQIDETHHKIRNKLSVWSASILLLAVLAVFIGVYDKNRRQNIAAASMISEAGNCIEDGEYSKEGIKIICGYLDSGCLNEEICQQFTYEAAKNYFEVQNNYKAAKRYFEKLDRELYPEACFFIELCRLQTEFSEDAKSYETCLLQFYEYNRSEGFSEKKYENDLMIAACYEQFADTAYGTKKAIECLETGWNELNTGKETESVISLKAEYARRLCLLYERAGEDEMKRFYGELALGFLGEEETAAISDIASRIQNKEEQE